MAPFLVVILLFRKNKKGSFEYAVFKRVKGNYWQVIVGVGEGRESPIKAARREAFEEAGIKTSTKYFRLKTMTIVPICLCPEVKDLHRGLHAIPAYYFAINSSGVEIILSSEHSEYKWVDYKSAVKLLCWDSDKTALLELNEKLQNNDILGKHKMSGKDIWSVYILKCRDGSLYTGISKDVSRRVCEHNSGKGAKYTKSKHPVKLVYQECHESHKSAMVKELEIKRWSRSKKLKIIKGK